MNVYLLRIDGERGPVLVVAETVDQVLTELDDIEQQNLIKIERLDAVRVIVVEG